MLKVERVVELIEKFKNLKIAVVGDMMIDSYLLGDVTRISREAPVPVVNVNKERFVLGGAANVSNNLRNLNSQVITYGVIGDDENGQKLIKKLEETGIEVSGLVIDSERPTIIKTRILAHNNQLLRIDWEKNEVINERIQKDIIDRLEKNIKNIEAIILSDYNKGVLSEYVSKKIIEIARKNNKIITVDPKPKNFINYVGATAITPNKKEILEYLGLNSFTDESDIENKAMKIKEDLDLKYLLLTRSEEGVSICSENYNKVSTMAKEVYDVTGAGDTLISVFTLALAAGATSLEAAKIGNIAAGIVVGKIGTATTTKEEIIKFYEDM